MVGRVRTGCAVRRSGAQVGDNIYVTGQLGSSLFGFEQLEQGNSSDSAVMRHLFPEPRYQVGPAIADQAHAMIDVSDGLSTDLGHILDESNVSARIYKDRLPIWPGAEERHALHGGEEYELVIVAPDLPNAIEGITVTRIGEIVASADQHHIVLIDGAHETVLRPQGWQHFKV
jgi:thiamine-monophosphate kinase